MKMCCSTTSPIKLRIQFWWHSTVVEHSHRHPMVKGLSPAAVASTERMEIYPSSILNFGPKIEVFKGLFSHKSNFALG